MNISACLVTRGDVDLTPVLESLPFDDVVIWNNAERENLKAYGRYAAIAEAKHDAIFVQDDDLVLSSQTFRLLEHAYDGSRPVVAAGKPGSQDVPWVGFGAIFPRWQPEVFHDIYRKRWGQDDLFLNYCDPIYTIPSQASTIYGSSTDLPWAFNPDRTSFQSDHWSLNRPEALKRAVWISQSLSPQKAVRP